MMSRGRDSKGGAARPAGRSGEPGSRALRRDGAEATYDRIPPSPKISAFSFLRSLSYSQSTFDFVNF